MTASDVDLVRRLRDMHDRVRGFGRANGERQALLEAATTLERLQAERDGQWQDIATDTLARIIFEACMAERVINGISGWDECNSETAYAGSTWKTHTPGLRAAEKLKWQRVAVRLRRTLPRSPT